jgi:hypothetical protein
MARHGAHGTGCARCDYPLSSPTAKNVTHDCCYGISTIPPPSPRLVSPNYYYLFNLSRDQRPRAVADTTAGTLSPTICYWISSFPPPTPRLVPPNNIIRIHPSTRPTGPSYYCLFSRSRDHVSRDQVTWSKAFVHFFESCRPERTYCQNCI